VGELTARCDLHEGGDPPFGLHVELHVDRGKIVFLSVTGELDGALQSYALAGPPVALAVSGATNIDAEYQPMGTPADQHMHGTKRTFRVEQKQGAFAVRVSDTKTVEVSCG
jgi:hypothetical protein